MVKRYENGNNERIQELEPVGIKKGNTYDIVFPFVRITSIIGTGAFLSAMSLSNPWPAYAVVFGIWILFFWGVAKRSQEAATRRERQRLYDEWLRSQSNGGRYY